MSIKLTTPCQVLEANAGFHREMSLVNSESETIEQELSWGVDSQIEVKGKHVGEAKLIILEEEYSGNFTIKTHIRHLVQFVIQESRQSLSNNIVNLSKRGACYNFKYFRCRTRNNWSSLR